LHVKLFIRISVPGEYINMLFCGDNNPRKSVNCWKLCHSNRNYNCFSMKIDDLDHGHRVIRDPDMITHRYKHEVRYQKLRKLKIVPRTHFVLARESLTYVSWIHKCCWCHCHSVLHPLPVLGYIYEILKSIFFWSSWSF
jgi:hypothetical protein